MAACPPLGLIVTSNDVKNTLSVWELPASGRVSTRASGGGGGGGRRRGGLPLLHTLGGDGWAAPMQFRFVDGMCSSGHLAFTSSSSTTYCRPMLVVTDAGHGAVHVVDVVNKTHVGYVAPPGSIVGPRSVAASRCDSDTPPLVAVTVWHALNGGDHVVFLHQHNGGGGGGAAWDRVRVIGGGFGGPGHLDGQLRMPCGLQFSRDGSVVCVADTDNRRASVFRIHDGGFVKHMDTMNNPLNVEEVEDGWLVARFPSHTVDFFSDGDGENVDDDVGRPYVGKAGGGRGNRDGEFEYPEGLAVVPDLGLVVRDKGKGGRLQVFAHPDTIAMWTNLSAIRLAWITAVMRGVRVARVV